MHKLFKFEDNGKTWTVRIVEPNDSYGRDMCKRNDQETLVEFYDADYDGFATDPNGTYLGQFVSRYYMDTLQGRCKWGGDAIGDGRGLCLHGGVEEWAISGDGMRIVATFLNLYEGRIIENYSGRAAHLNRS